MAGHVFVSYSHEDSRYVVALTDHLLRHGIDVWTDQGIDYGAQWPGVIESQIESCAAFVLVMSDHSRRAPWVAREIDLAQELGKPIFPLLLSGRRFLQLREVQDEDVRTAGMPSLRFIEQLRDAASDAQARGVATVGPASTPRAGAINAVMASLTRRRQVAGSIGDGGDPEEAARQLREIVGELVATLGADHPSTLAARHDLAVNVRKSGNADDAIRQFHSLVVDRTRVLGSGHPETLDSRQALAGCYAENGQAAEAVRQLTAIVSERAVLYGPTHTDTLGARGDLAIATFYAGHRWRATRQLRELLKVWQRVYGDSHPDTQLTRAVLDHATKQTRSGGMR